MTLANPQAVSLNGAKFTAIREACVTHAYPDGTNKDGSQAWSIGFGSQTPPPKDGDVTTIEGAFSRLRADIKAREPAVNKALKVQVSQGAFDALFSLYYQAGSKALAAVAEKFNTGPSTWAIAEFLKWNFGANGVPTEGHTKRRIREMIMALDDNYGDLSKVMVFDGNPREVKPVWMPFPESL